MKEIKFIDWSHQIDGVWEVILPYWQTERGVNFEGLNRNIYPEEFQSFFNRTPVDSFSYSKEGALRGFHADFNEKLIQILYGKMQFAIYDCRPPSKTFGNHLEFIVRHDELRQFLIPKFVANAHLALSKEILFSYKLSEDYCPAERQMVINYKDVPVNWLISNPIVGERDQ